MSLSGYNRQFLRAPLGTNIIFGREGFVRKGKVINISEGGLLLSSPEALPEEAEYFSLIDLPLFPPLQQLSSQELKALGPETMERRIFRPQFMVAPKRFEGETEFQRKVEGPIGCYFTVITNEAQTHIQAYVRTFAKNIIYLLKLLEGSSNLQDHSDLRLVAEILGYPKDMKISFLRQKVLHDYQSLQWL